MLLGDNECFAVVLAAKLRSQGGCPGIDSNNQTRIRILIGKGRNIQTFDDPECISGDILPSPIRIKGFCLELFFRAGDEPGRRSHC